MTDTRSDCRHGRLVRRETSASRSSSSCVFSLGLVLAALLSFRGDIIDSLWGMKRVQERRSRNLEEAVTRRVPCVGDHVEIHRLWPFLSLTLDDGSQAIYLAVVSGM